MTDQEETIDGHPCKVENVILTPTDGRPLAIKMQLWEAKDLNGFPVKITIDAGGHTVTSTYTDVSLEAPDPKLFKLPANCKTFPTKGAKGSIKFVAPSSESTPKASPPEQ